MSGDECPSNGGELLGEKALRVVNNLDALKKLLVVLLGKLRLGFRRKVVVPSSRFATKQQKLQSIIYFACFSMLNLAELRAFPANALVATGTLGPAPILNVSLVK